MPIILSYTGGFLQTNACFLAHNSTPDNGILIDAPDGTADWLEERRLKPSALLLTHLHFDHILGAGQVQSAFGCPIYAHSTRHPDLTLENLFKGFMGTSFSIDPFTVNHLLAGRTSLAIAGHTLRLLHLPGHSPDSLGFYCEAAGAIFSGDVLMAGGVGRVDFPGGSWKTLESSIRHGLYTLPDSTLVYPGHGPTTTIGEEKRENPFVNDQG